jgi:antitoxin HicB
MLDSYIAKFQDDDGGLLVTFPNIPEAVTGGSTDEEAFANAQEALELALLTYANDGRAIPVASKRSAAAGRSVSVPVAASVAAKIAFIIAFRESGLTRVALAKRLGKAETEVRRMLDPYHQTKLPAIEAGLKALGKRLVVSIAEAA